LNRQPIRVKCVDKNHARFRLLKTLLDKTGFRLGYGFIGDWHY